MQTTEIIKETAKQAQRLNSIELFALFVIIIFVSATLVYVYFRLKFSSELNKKITSIDKSVNHSNECELYPNKGLRTLTALVLSEIKEIKKGMDDIKKDIVELKISNAVNEKEIDNLKNI